MTKERAIKLAEQTRGQAQRQCNHNKHMNRQRPQFEWGHIVAATETARKALAICYAKAYKNVEHVIPKQQRHENDAEITTMIDFIQRKGEKNGYVCLLSWLDMTARKTIVVPLKTRWERHPKRDTLKKKTFLSGYKLYETVAKELQLLSSKSIVLRPQRPWFPYIHRASIIEPTVIVPRSKHSNCKHLLGQNLVYITVDPQGGIHSDTESDTESNTESDTP